MSDAPSSGGATTRDDGVEAVESTTEPATDIHQETQPELLDARNIEAANKAPSELEASLPESPANSPIFKGEDVFRPQNQSELVSERTNLPEPLNDDTHEDSLSDVSLLSIQWVARNSRTEPEALREFEEVYSKEEHTPSEMVVQIVNYIKSLRDEFDWMLEEVNADLQHSQQANRDLQETIDRYNEKWVEIDRQLMDHPRIPFSFANLIRQIAISIDGDSGSERKSSFGGEYEQSNSRAVSSMGSEDGLARSVGNTDSGTGWVRGHRRNNSETPLGDLVPLAQKLEVAITKLRVTTLINRARESFVQNNATKTLELAREIKYLGEKPHLKNERLLMARGLFWRSRALFVLGRPSAAAAGFLEAIAMGLNPSSDCAEGDLVNGLMKEAKRQAEALANAIG